MAALQRMAGRLGRIGAWSVELPGFEVEWSDEVCAIHEVPAGFAPSVATAIEFYAPDFREAITAAFGACVGEGTPFDVELQIVAKGGRRVWVRVIGEAVRNGAGIIQRVQGATQDISDRKQAEDENRQLNARLITALEGAHAALASWRQLADAMPQIVWSAPPDGGINYVNQRWLDYTGTTSEVAVADSMRAVVHPEDVEAVQSSWGLAVAEGREYETAARFRRADGEYRWHLLRARPVRDAQGAITKWYGTSTDIQDQKTATESAERANRAKSEFLANMSHEIRTPMNGIIGLTELLLATTLTRVQHDYLLMIGDSADRLLSVINGILDFSKIESGALLLETRPFHLRELVAEAVRSVSVAADTKGLELSYRVASDVPEDVEGDDGRLGQVLLNLMSNAVKFTARGHVVLEIDNEWCEGGELALHAVVRDTGIGIPPERREAIFQPFTQVDGSTTRQFGGTGLGLTIASQLVALMGGAIWVESEVGRGSAFHFRVRLAVSGAAGEGEGASDAGALRGRRVLVADDVAINHRILEEMLRAWGCAPVLVSSGESALAALAEARNDGDPFEIVLLDARMPGLSGFEVVDKLRRGPAASPLVLMMLSSSNQATEAVRCHDLGDLPYVVKPVDPSSLLDALLNALEPLVGAGIPSEAPAADGPVLKVLVAEDNKVNQRLILDILEGLGHQVTLVPNGRDAVTAAQTGDFDVVLMDVHMPEMDGLEATAAIRAAERDTDRHIPIAALTARALKGDRATCLAAGMDDYLPKPIRVPALVDVLARLAGGAPNAPNATNATNATNARNAPNASAAAGSPPLARFDPADVLVRVQGDRELLAELVDIFRAESPRLLAALRHGVRDGDARAVQEAAHAIKGTVGNFGAPAACAAAAALEAMGRDARLANAAAAVVELEREVDDLERSLVALCSEEASPVRPSSS